MSYSSYNKIVIFIIFAVFLTPFFAFAARYSSFLEPKERIEYIPQSSGPLLTDSQKLAAFNAIQRFKNVTVKNYLAKMSNLEPNRIIIPSRSFSYKDIYTVEEIIFEDIIRISQKASTIFFPEFIESKNRIEIALQPSLPLLSEKQKLSIFSAIQHFKNSSVKFTNLKSNRIITPSRSFSYKDIDTKEKIIIENARKIKQLAGFIFFSDFIELD